jgi:hypothetical protein
MRGWRVVMSNEHHVPQARLLVYGSNFSTLWIKLPNYQTCTLIVPAEKRNKELGLRAWAVYLSSLSNRVDVFGVN